MSQDPQKAYEEGYIRAQKESQEEIRRLMNENKKISSWEPHFRDIQLELRSQGLSGSIRKFSGESNESFREWTADMEKAAKILAEDDERLRALALQTLGGSAGEMVARVLNEAPQITWKELKYRLTQRYSDTADREYSRQLLKRKVQRKDESVTTYFENLLTIAREAYGDQDLNNRWIQSMLVEIFIDGVCDNRVARKLIRRKPNTLHEALDIALQEQQTDRSYNLRRGETPMEVDALENASTHEGQSQLLERIEQLERQLRAVTVGTAGNQPAPRPSGAHSTPTSRAGGNPPPRRENWPSGVNRPPPGTRNSAPTGYRSNPPNRNQNSPLTSLTCYKCGGRGHFQRDCPSNNHLN